MVGISLARSDTHGPFGMHITAGASYGGPSIGRLCGFTPHFTKGNSLDKRCEG